MQDYEIILTPDALNRLKAMKEDGHPGIMVFDADAAREKYLRDHAAYDKKGIRELQAEAEAAELKAAANKPHVPSAEQLEIAAKAEAEIQQIIDHKPGINRDQAITRRKKLTALETEVDRQQAFKFTFEDKMKMLDHQLECHAKGQSCSGMQAYYAMRIREQFGAAINAPEATKLVISAMKARSATLGLSFEEKMAIEMFKVTNKELKLPAQDAAEMAKAWIKLPKENRPSIREYAAAKKRSSAA